MEKIKNSQVATENSYILGSTNSSGNKGSKIDNSKMIRKIKKDSAIISFIVGVITSLASSYIYDHFLK